MRVSNKQMQINTNTNTNTSSSDREQEQKQTQKKMQQRQKQSSFNQLTMSIKKHQVVLSIILSVVAIVSHIQQVDASGIFEINFASLVDAYGRDLRDECCSWQQNNTAEQQYANTRTYPTSSKQYQCDPSKCQLIIRICVKNYQITQIEPSQCFFGELSAQVMKPSEPAQFVQYPTYSTRVQHLSASLSAAAAAAKASPLPLNKRMFGHHHQVQQSQSQQHHHHQQQQQPSSATAANIHHHRLLQQQATLNFAGPRHNQHNQFLPSSGHSRSLRHINFQQSISFPFNFTWPGSFSLIIDAWYESTTGFQQVALPFTQELDARDQQTGATTTYDLFKKQLIITHSMRGYLAVKNEWTNEVHKTDTATLAYSYRVTCQPNYYGEQCNILCKPRDDVYGHFTCSPRGDIVCLTGWSGSYCRDPICSPGCHKDQGNCSRPNKCSCRLGWQGPSCEECIRYPGCVHGSCNKPYECNCQEGWGGLLCNEDLKYCTNQQPCKNGGLCENTFHSEGAPYTCTCPPGFAGKDCEEVVGIDQPFLVYNSIVNSTSANDINMSNIHSNSNSNKRRTSTTPAPNNQNLQANQIIVNSNQAVASSTLPKQPKPQSASTTPAPQSPIQQHSSHHNQAPAFANIINSGSFNGVPSHYTQAVMQQPQQPFEIVAAYVVIIVCMVILVVFLLLKIFFDRTNQRHWSQESGHVEDVATMQNHQNIYKSRTSLSADKMPYDTLDSPGTSSSSSSPSTSSSNINTIADTHQHRRHHRSHHNLQQTVEGPLNPPPPYTISHTHPNSTYISSIYNGSIYGHPSTNHTASNAPTNPTTISLYGASTNSAYGQLAGPVVSAANANPYGSINSTYQSPRYVICHLLEVDQDTIGASAAPTTTTTNQHQQQQKIKTNGQK